ncbi:sodium/calcium exchanger 2 isoform X3 [Lepeophtheirus salmonis]|uniref:sodium/calcium exchanger 2 isoform X3 n=1 Tax=Lepeophtheirus salmonis TaxID=72036 RepID=UPI001AE8F85D|nr:sodium/calcium exchanger 2-like isoform X3 [Lepeophtheirus salmonis]
MATSFLSENKTSVCFFHNETATDPEYCGSKDVCSTLGLLLPFFLEMSWPVPVRTFLYLFALLYSFLGVSIIADIFMCAIEKITSKTKRIHFASAGDDEPDVIEVPVWNGTVANLTLMALGSSAPEILLSIIEITGNNFEAGELGPGTIVGSAAFNLLAISAVCVASIPSGEIRRVKQIIVFMVTSTFSIFAYVWLLVILKWNTPNVVDLWEAILTFAFFPILVIIAYAADKQWLRYLVCKKPVEESDKKRQIELGMFRPGEESEGMLKNQPELMKGGSWDREGLVTFIKDIKKNTKLSDEDAAILAASKIVDSTPHSRMWYRIGAVRNMTGGRKTQPSLRMNEKLKEGLAGLLAPLSSQEGKLQVYDAINENPEAPNISYPDEDEDTAIVEFHASSASVMENIGTYNVTVVRHGKLDSTIKVRIETIDGSANEGEDYVGVNEILTFEPYETQKEIGITIVDDNQWEPDEEFFVKLALLYRSDADGVKLGKSSIMEITILNDDEPGIITFEKRGILVKESCLEAEISVIRRNGADGRVTAKWKTIDKTAINGKDFKGGEGELEFNHGETHRTIAIPIVNDMDFEKDENFEVELFEATGGAKIGKINRTAVTITNDDDFTSMMSKMMTMTSYNVDGMRVHNETWAQQFKDAMNVNGGDIEGATLIDYIMHFMTFGFKIIFAFVPPPGVGGGWPCFFISLGMIGILTAIVGDLASIFGCLVGLKPSITAITFVALGTSLPDTFASKAAAVGEKHADNAIGNITGSNSVNVFLGLGLPWLMAAIYHKTQDGQFNVPAGDLSVSVTLYTICAVLAVLLLLVRRFLGIFGNAELGGPNLGKYISATFLLILWFLYILFSTLQTYGIISL